MERRERLSGWLLLFFGGAAIATAALAFHIFSDDIELNDEYIRLGPEETVEEENAPFIWGEAEPGPAPEPDGEGNENGDPIIRERTDQPRTVGEPLQPTEQTFNFPPPPREDQIPTFMGPPAGSVDRETARALRSGKAQIWREDGERGYVLVSGIVSYGARECRQISYSRFEQGRQTTSAATQWCRQGVTGKWRPDPRGPE